MKSAKYLPNSSEAVQCYPEIEVFDIFSVLLPRPKSKPEASIIDHICISNNGPTWCSIGQVRTRKYYTYDGGTDEGEVRISRITCL